MMVDFIFRGKIILEFIFTFECSHSQKNEVVNETFRLLGFLLQENTKSIQSFYFLLLI